jgi:glycosyltransferase involved in cell wall biosynthesis
VRSQKLSNTERIEQANWLDTATERLRRNLGNAVMRLQRPHAGSGGPRSGNFIPSRWAEKINATDCDVVNLHWVGAETMSIEDIGRIRKPVVWTLHDMWAFCGAEHVEPNDTRWIAGYTAENRKALDSGIDLDRLVWDRKRKAWRFPLHVVTPSQWLADCASRSALFRDAQVTVIPNVIDPQLFKPLDQRTCRSLLGLPQNAKLILFGAIRPGADSNKGYDLLIDALHYLVAAMRGASLECVVFGDVAVSETSAFPMPVHWMGQIDTDDSLVQLYSAADVMVVPSRVENLPQTATEAQSCGCPVAAFNTTGLPDAVEHLGTGCLAEPYVPESLAASIAWLLADEVRLRVLREAARARATRLWCPDVIVPQYLRQFEQAAFGKWR